MSYTSMAVEPSLLQRIEQLVLESTHGRIRDLKVEEDHGQVVIRGQVPSHHTRQLVLHAALELVASDRFRSCITVG